MFVVCQNVYMQGVTEMSAKNLTSDVPRSEQQCFLITFFLNLIDFELKFFKDLSQIWLPAYDKHGRF